MKIITSSGVTPLNPDEMGELIPDFISTQGELNSLEAENISIARSWALSKQRKNILTDTFLQQLHSKMFCEVWRWAGKYRKTDKNLGVHYPQIPVEVYKLCNDTLFWIEHNTYSWQELGARFHHKLVSIHPFSNGNGRHARLAADILMFNYEKPLFSWGKTKTRENYLQALREADNGKFSLLLDFIQS